MFVFLLPLLKGVSRRKQTVKKFFVLRELFAAIIVFDFSRLLRKKFQPEGLKTFEVFFLTRLQSLITKYTFALPFWKEVVEKLK